MVPYSTLAEDSSQVSSSTKKLRLACDVCHSAKTRCCGSNPCARCVRCGTQCVYSQSNRAGRPKGTRNKKSVDNSKIDSDHRDSSSPQQQEQHRQQESQQPPTRNRLNRSSSSSSGTGNPASNIPSSIPSFTVPSFSPPLEHSQPHLHQQKYVNNMVFDFNPSGDFSDQANAMLHSSLPAQSHFSFPMVPNDMNVDAAEIQMAFDMEFNVDEMQHGCNIPNLSENFTITRHNTGASGTSMTEILRDSVLQSFEQEDIPYSQPQHVYSEPLSKSSTNSHSNGNSSGGSGSPSMLHPRDPIDAYCSKGAQPNSAASSNSNPDNISLTELRCQCLQRHVQFLAHLQELLNEFHRLPLDVVLNGVDQGLKVWDLCLQCRMCQQDRNREVMLLTVTSIRAVARILQKASQRIFTQSQFDDGDQHISCSDGSESGVEVERQRLGKFTFGSYEIKGEESWLVVGVILTRMLAKIQIVLVSFKKSLNSPHSHTASSHRGDNSAEYLHKLLEGLQANVHALSANLMSGTYDRLG
ncbi:uncharacterized protein A1O9_00566 [Exophiala aquamarina CBS 119918]|uniref:Zn(2)-C6 fungal-type domain-containing protein n=1 Tax=Exophiala aquamarina CBS 119918 TaxID=1182545 RepID=A0A072PTB6_9EURO|nr:uncharacterized protein A1O9_00566 [Exophiala aquamarina CBS 119918]KEF62593.1 hypothetical protein A1O9_00566 [Exophiala aquamarina CBS 119918]